MVYVKHKIKLKTAIDVDYYLSEFKPNQRIDQKNKEL